MGGCELTKPAKGITMAETFGSDLAFLKRHTEVIVLSSGNGRAQVAVSGALQGRVMTSTAEGAQGLSYGWIKRELIASGENDPHINAYGGEDRFWLGPEGGQFSIFFTKGDPFDLEHWFTPPPINEQAFEVVAREKDRVVFQKKMRLTNYSDTNFDLELTREIKLLTPSEINDKLGIAPSGGVKTVAFQSDNVVTNTGQEAWIRQTGLLSIWILGMFKPSASTTVVIPFYTGSEAERGPIVNDAYFGKAPPEQLVVKAEAGVLFFRGDGKLRNKIGLSPQRARSMLGSYDAAHQVLTLVQYNQPQGVTDYVNSMWQFQEKPYAGDVVNSYNDGPAAPGAEPFGPFYELETSSPALTLKPGQSARHVHRTFHFQGPEEQLDEIARAALGVPLAEIKTALK
ncbi:MAG: hypothetical protein AMJ79_11645 [Phycisphaerae bacterium SM23_30]|nr:MAG: hypothetical protein AMJ79_11645 [Phycisphaerae bacterium SM23_30]